ncbi:hypothetical protein V6N12_028852 [Hibiscus sabdariffa]|uniref:Uncharacterized protein n=1 Tax=Hibiscus sabdariffa TaxID=183260 RepID=A0ABR2F724_9ROSI
MAQPCYTTKVLENGSVSPPPGNMAPTAIPLTFLDTLWLSCCPMQRLFFYEFPHPTSHFMQKILPNLKSSLSLTLQHFFPFSGNLRLLQRPYIFFTDGNSIPFIVTESDADFNHLISNHRRHGRELQALLPKLPPPSNVVSDGTSVCKQLPLMAIQITIFSNAGFSIGITFLHAAADGKAFAHFTKSWASICRSKGDLSFIRNSPPISGLGDPRKLSWVILVRMVRFQWQKAVMGKVGLNLG